MKRKMGFFGGTLLLFVAALPAVATVGTQTLKILNKSISSENRTLAFDLWNNTDRVITAWRLSLAYDDGFGKGRRSILDQDFALSAVSREDAAPASRGTRIDRPIQPGEVVSSEWDIELPDGGAGAAVLGLRVAAVVFEDGSFAGEPDGSEAILAARSARLEEMKKTLEFLRKTRSKVQRGVSAKESLASRSRELREESSPARLSEGLRREVAAQLSVAKLEMAELLENLEASLAVEVVVGDEAPIETTIKGLAEQIEAGEGRAGRNPVHEGIASAEGAREEVQ